MDLQGGLHCLEYYELAGFYDLLTQTYTDYQEQVDFVQQALSYYQWRPGRVLDLACGTGAHSLLLTKAGYQVVGVDLSGQMLRRARQKAAALGLAIPLHQADLRELPYDRSFSAALCLNFSLTYMLTNEDLRRALRSTWKALQPGGLFLFDLAYQFSPEPWQEMAWEEGRNIRVSSVESIDWASQVILRRSSYWVGEGEGMHEYQGLDRRRLTLSQDMLYHLEAEGFQVRGQHRRWVLKQEPDNFSALIVAQKPNS